MNDREKIKQYAENPQLFRDDLLLDVDGSVKSLGVVVDDWQRNDFDAIDNGLQAAIGRHDGTDTPISRAYLERPRGHSKTCDLAITSVYALAFATRPIKAFAYAADRDQSKLLLNAIQTILRCNLWLQKILVCKTHQVENVAAGHPAQGSVLNVEASDVGSSYGILPDVLILDEITHWGESSSELWNSLISSAAKRANCLLVCIANAGFVDSWQWGVRETIRKDTSWYFSRLDGPRASWLDEKRLAEQERLLPKVAYARLWENQWSSGGGDALTPDDIAASFSPENVRPEARAKGTFYCAGIDLGLTRDNAAVITLGVQKGGRSSRIFLADHKIWKPVSGQKLDLLEIEKYVLNLDKRFRLENIVLDPWQSEHLAQRLEADSKHKRRNTKRTYASQPWCKVMPPVAANLRQQASLLIESFTDRRFSFYECEPLRQDLQKARVEERSYGYRITSPRDSTGHGDSLSAFALALVCIHELAGKSPRRVVGSIDKPADANTRFEKMIESEMAERELEKMIRDNSDDLDELNQNLFFASSGKRGKF